MSARTREEWAAQRRVRWHKAFELVASGEASQRVCECVELAEREGLGMRGIAKRLGLSTATVGRYLNDPTGEKDKERKHRRYGICIDCGTKIYNSGSEPGARCQHCARANMKVEARRRIIEALHDWVSRYGRPPGAMDWNVVQAHVRAHPERLAQIEAAHRDRDWPRLTSVINAFGGWNAALAAAGLPTLKSGQRRDPGLHMKGRPKMLSPIVVIDREIEKNEQRRETLKLQIADLEANVAQLKKAKELLASNPK